MNNKSVEYITRDQALTVKEMFRKYLKSYKAKDVNISDEEWLEQLFRAS